MISVTYVVAQKRIQTFIAVCWLVSIDRITNQQPYF